jgi:iron complex transport system substrate-binding protein
MRRSRSVGRWRWSIALFLPLLSLAAQPQRIVSTGPSITEILFALGLGSKVVGVTQYCTFPVEAQKIRKIGTWMTPNMEAILEARPDLVIVQKTGIHDDSRYKAMSLNSMMVRLDSVSDILQATETIGAVTGTQARASQLAGEIRRELESVKQLVKGKRPARALFVVGRTPGALEGLIVVGKGSYISGVIEYSGGKNIFEDSVVAYPKILHEAILSRDPEVIIDMGEHPDASPITDAQKQREIALWRKYPSLSAVRNNRVNIVSSDLFVHPGPRVVDLARVMAKLFHPELFR